MEGTSELTFNEAENRNPDGVHHISLMGRIDSTNTQTFEEQIIERTTQMKQLLIDFEHVDFISSSGLRVLLMAAKRMNGHLVLCNLKTHIADVFRMSGFHRIIKIEPNRASALEKLRAALRPQRSNTRRTQEQTQMEATEITFNESRDPDGVHHISLMGRVDSTNTQTFEEQIMGRAARVKQMLIDLEHVDFISSSGLRVLLMAAKKLDGRLVLCNLKAHIADVFNVSGFHRIIKIEPNQAAALDRLRAAAAGS